MIAALDDPQRKARKDRAARRLRALGIDPETMVLDQIRQFYETQRAAFVNVARAGLHTTPIHGDNDPLPGACADSRYGILTDALIDYFGALPAGWSPVRHKWPEPGEPATATVTAVQDRAPAPTPPQPREIAAATPTSRWAAATEPTIAAEDLDPAPIPEIAPGGFATLD